LAADPHYPHHVADESDRDHRPRHRGHVPFHLLELLPEQASRPRESAGPGEGADRREHQEARQRHLRQAGRNGDERPYDRHHPAQKLAVSAVAFEPDARLTDVPRTHRQTGTVSFQTAAELITRNSPNHPVPEAGYRDRTDGAREDGRTE